MNQDTIPAWLERDLPSHATARHAVIAAFANRIISATTIGDGPHWSGFDDNFAMVVMSECGRRWKDATHKDILRSLVSLTRKGCIVLTPIGVPDVVSYVPEIVTSAT